MIKNEKWEKVFLGELADEITERVDNPSQSGFELFVGLEHFVSGDLKIKQWGSTKNLVSAMKKFQKGDILFARRNAYLKRSSIVEFDGVCSGDAFVIREKKDRLVPGFLAFIFNSESLWNYANSYAAGTMSKRVKWRDLAKYSFKLPLLNEQKRLADLLWSVDEAIESYCNLLNELVISRNSLLKQNYRDIQKELHAISYIAEINPRIDRKNIEKGMIVSFVTMADISEEGYIINKEDRKYSEVEKGFTPFKDGDILFAKITPCMENGKGAIASDLINGLGFGSTELHVIRPKDKYDRYYLYYLTRMFHLRKKAEQLMTGSAGQKRVPSNFFDLYKFNLPEKGKRKNLGDQMRKYDYEIDHLKKNIMITKNIQKQIINQTFGGKS